MSEEWACLSIATRLQGASIVLGSPVQTGSLPLVFVVIALVHPQVRIGVTMKAPFISIRRKGQADALEAAAAGDPQAPVLDDKTREGAEAFEAKCMR